MKDMGELVRSGGMDSYLIRPLNPLVYLVVRQFQYTFCQWYIGKFKEIYIVCRYTMEINENLLYNGEVKCPVGNREKAAVGQFCFIHTIYI
jgi:ABC-type uncharacterized transport system permease subunit